MRRKELKPVVEIFVNEYHKLYCPLTGQKIFDDDSDADWFEEAAKIRTVKYIFCACTAYASPDLGLTDREADNSGMLEKALQRISDCPVIIRVQDGWNEPVEIGLALDPQHGDPKSES